MLQHGCTAGFLRTFISRAEPDAPGHHPTPVLATSHNPQAPQRETKQGCTEYRGCLALASHKPPQRGEAMRDGPWSRRRRRSCIVPSGALQRRPPCRLGPRRAVRGGPSITAAPSLLSKAVRRHLAATTMQVRPSTSCARRPLGHGSAVAPEQARAAPSTGDPLAGQVLDEPCEAATGPGGAAAPEHGHAAPSGGDKHADQALVELCAAAPGHGSAVAP